MADLIGLLYPGLPRLQRLSVRHLDDMSSTPASSLKTRPWQGKTNAHVRRLQHTTRPREHCFSSMVRFSYPVHVQAAPYGEASPELASSMPCLCRCYHLLCCTGLDPPGSSLDSFVNLTLTARVRRPPWFDDAGTRVVGCESEAQACPRIITLPFSPAETNSTTAISHVLEWRN